jgi:hypothetical protein
MDNLVNKLKEMFGDSLVDPEVFPKVFAYQVMLAKYELSLQKETQ